MPSVGASRAEGDGDGEGEGEDEAFSGDLAEPTPAVITSATADTAASATVVTDSESNATP